MTLIPNSFKKLSGIPNVVQLKKKKTALLMIEFQAEHFTGALPVQEAQTLIEPGIKIMKWADKNQIPVIHVRHLAKSPASPVFAPDSEGSEFYPPFIPAKKHLIHTKYASSIFSGSDLHMILQAQDIDTVILTGMSTPSCITASAHDAQLLGYKCLVVADITASRDILSWDGSRVIPAAQMQQSALANISDKYAGVMTCSEVLALPFQK